MSVTRSIVRQEAAGLVGWLPKNDKLCGRMQHPMSHVMTLTKAQRRVGNMLLGIVIAVSAPGCARKDQVKVHDAPDVKP